MLVVSLVGFIDAAYLTAEHYAGSTPSCFLVEGCDVVTTSAYAVVFGVPVALLGALYYLSIFVLSVAYLDSHRDWMLKLSSGATATGFLVSVYLVSVQVFILQQICIYCMASAFTSTTLFAIGSWTLWTYRQKTA